MTFEQWFAGLQRVDAKAIIGGAVGRVTGRAQPVALRKLYSIFTRRTGRLGDALYVGQSNITKAGTGGDRAIFGVRKADADHRKAAALQWGATITPKKGKYLILRDPSGSVSAQRVTRQKQVTIRGRRFLAQLAEASGDQLMKSAIAESLEAHFEWAMGGR